MPDGRPPKPEPALLTPADRLALLRLRREVFSRHRHMRDDYDRLGIDYGQRDAADEPRSVLKFPGV